MVLKTDRFHITDSLHKTLHRFERNWRGLEPNAEHRWKIRFDSDFEAVCAQPRRHGPWTWISEDMVSGYCTLHRAGYVYSSEVWLDGELVGGFYGASIGRMFYDESMFAQPTSMSKIALAYLVHFLKSQGVELIDCQQKTSHLASLGAAPISRDDFLFQLRQAISGEQISH